MNFYRINYKNFSFRRASHSTDLITRFNHNTIQFVITIQYSLHIFLVASTWKTMRSATKWRQFRGFDFSLPLPSRRTLNGNLEESRSITRLAHRVSVMCCHKLLKPMTNFTARGQVGSGSRELMRLSSPHVDIFDHCPRRSMIPGAYGVRRCDALTPAALIPATEFPSSCVKRTFTSRISLRMRLILRGLFSRADRTLRLPMHFKPPCIYVRPCTLRWICLIGFDFIRTSVQNYDIDIFRCNF